MAAMKQLDGETPPVFRAEPAIAADVNDDRLIAYALAADPVFTAMRSLIGQLSGILLLAQARLWREVADLPDMRIARERWRETVDQLGGIAAPEGRKADLRRLREATAHVEKAIAIIGEMSERKTNEGVAGASAHLKAAYRLMQEACDHRLGLSIVDASAACCSSCGSKLA
jgi:hypothetical protein